MSEAPAFPLDPASSLDNELPFSFTGTGREYFGIWIINLMLSILTLGIYSAWAKVRRQRYFYGNTWLDGHNFEYHARPVQILIGRIIVFGYLILVNIMTEISPLIGLALLVPYLIALPWVLNKALAFNARMTSYRNVHLSFSGTYLKALGIFVAFPLLIMLPFLALSFAAGYFAQSNPGALGWLPALSIVALLLPLILIPYYTRLSNNYIGNNTRFGNARFATDLPVKAIFANMGATVLFSLGFMLLFGLVAGGIFYLLGQGADLEEAMADPMENVGIMAAFVVGGLLLYTPIILAFTFYGAGIRNIAFNHTTLDGIHRFRSEVGRLRYVWIIFSNVVLTLLSFALLRPWAAVRTWRYIIGSTTFVAGGSLDNFINTQEPLGNVAAAEYLDIDGIDFGI